MSLDGVNGQQAFVGQPLDPFDHELFVEPGTTWGNNHC